MPNTITIRLDTGLRRALEHFARKEGMSKSDLVRKTLRRQMAVRKFQELRAEMVPKAMAMGIYTDEDVFRLLEESK